jgi:Zn-dependent oligopeptidase
MEYWLLQDPIRQSLAHFSQWPDTIPSEELQRQREELIMDKIHTTMHHIYEGVLELQLFSQFDPKQGDSLVEFQRRLAEHYRPTDIPAKGDLSTLMGLIHDHCSFEFVLARYHYLISDILAAQVFSVFERKGFQDADAMRQCGLEFRRLLSTPGVTAHDTLDAIAKFSGQKPLLMEHLLKYYPVPAKEEPTDASKAMIS